MNEDNRQLWNRIMLIICAAVLVITIGVSAIENQRRMDAGRDAAYIEITRLMQQAEATLTADAAAR